MNDTNKSRQFEPTQYSVFVLMVIVSVVLEYDRNDHEVSRDNLRWNPMSSEASICHWEVLTIVSLNISREAPLDDEFVGLNITDLLIATPCKTMQYE